MLLACVVDITALVTSTSFRLRLKILHRKGRDEQFAKVKHFCIYVDWRIIYLHKTRIFVVASLLDV